MATDISVISADPLDNADFDAVTFINQRFPNEEALGELDTFLVAVGSQISALDEEISSTVQAQSSAGQLATREISESEAAIAELFSLVKEIKAKANQSEKTVQEICFDIKRLDCAKTHLQGTITSLKRLQMLLTATQQLEQWRDLPLREVANMLEAVSSIMVHFERYTETIPKIADVKARVEKIRAELVRHVQASFSEIGQLVDTVADASIMVDDHSNGNGGFGLMRSLSEACMVADALGAKTRQLLMDEFVKQQLGPYDNLFGEGRPHNTLDQVERRWAWFKRLLKTVDLKFSTIIPATWRVQLELYIAFCTVSRRHLLFLLRNNEDNSDVSALVKALQTALRFEQEMKTRFEEVPPSETQENLEESDHNARDSNPREALKPSVSTVNTVSSAFDNFLGPYVKLERNNLEELLQRLDQEEDTLTNTASTGGGTIGSVYGSATSMFVFIKSSIKRCTALSNGSTFLLLTREFKGCMVQYAESLRQRLPIPSGMQNPIYKLAPGGEVPICYIINTCEYCAEVIPTLESIIQKTIASELADQIDLSNETEVFQDLGAVAVKALVSGTLDKLEPSFKSMQSLSWATMTSVGEESPYVYKWQATLQEMVPKIREIVTDVYFRSFCTKLATDILARYLDVIMRQKKISEIGTQQLLLDTYNVKTLLLQLENIGGDGEKVAPSFMFGKLVNARTAHIEIVLKLIATPEEMLLERFKIMWSDGKVADLQGIMNLKDMKRADQQKYLEAFGGSVSSSVASGTSASMNISLASLTQGLSSMNAFGRGL